MYSDQKNIYRLSGPCPRDRPRLGLLHLSQLAGVGGGREVVCRERTVGAEEGSSLCLGRGGSCRPAG